MLFFIYILCTYANVHTFGAINIYTVLNQIWVLPDNSEMISSTFHPLFRHTNVFHFLFIFFFHSKYDVAFKFYIPETDADVKIWYWYLLQPSNEQLIIIIKKLSKRTLDQVPGL